MNRVVLKGPQNFTHSRNTCTACYAPATHVEVTHRPTTRISRTGVVTKAWEQHSVYYCDAHRGAT